MNSIRDLFQTHRDELTYKLPQGRAGEIFSATVGRSASRSWFAIPVAAALAGLLISFQLGKHITDVEQQEAILQEVTSGHVRSMMVSHLSDVVSTDQHTVKPWFEGKIDFAPTIKDFSEQGFPLTGGRLDYISGRPVAAVVYKFNQHVINVFQWPAPSTGSKEMKLSQQRGFNIYSWQTDGMSFWAVLHEIRSDFAQIMTCLFLMLAGPGSLHYRKTRVDAVKRQ